MTLSELGTTEFLALRPGEQIRAFAWYLHDGRGLSEFSTATINECFDTLHLPRPSNTSQLLKQLIDQKVLLGKPSSCRASGGLRRDMTAKYGLRPGSILIARLLTELPTQLVDPVEQDYLSEAITCLRASAFRATCVMAWNVAYDHLLTKLFTHHLPAFNAQLAVQFHGRKPAVTMRDDFQELKESEVITVSRAAGILSKEVAKVFEEKLQKRNSCAHPSRTKVAAFDAESFVHDLIVNGVLRLP